jgi:biopolymer transport protein ExbD
MSDLPNQRKKNKKVRPPDSEPDPEFQIAPMIDILLVLLVFFMSISSTEVLQSNKEITLPVAKEAKEAKDNPGQVIINVTYAPINDSTAIEVDQKDYAAPADIVPLLKSKVTDLTQVRLFLLCLNMLMICLFWLVKIQRIILNTQD